MTDLGERSGAVGGAGQLDQPPNGRRVVVRDAGRVLQRLTLPACWAVVIVVFGILKPNQYLTLGNASNILGSQAVLVVLALAIMVPLTAGVYDLSAASILTLTSVTVAVLNVQLGVPIWAAILVSILVGLLCSFINAILVVRFELDSFIATLGTGTLFLGVGFWLTKSATITGIAPGLDRWVALVAPGGIPIEAYYALAACVVLWYIYDATPLGQRLVFVGQNRAAARLTGINDRRIIFGSLVCCGTLAGVAGIMYAGTTGAADPTSGSEFLLPAFAAVFLGATSIRPGRFNPWGTWVAVYFLVSGITGLELLGGQYFVQDLFYGGALVVGVLFAKLTTRQKAKG